MESQGQIAVAPRLTTKHEHMSRAVHRLNAHLLAFRFDQEHIFAIVRPMPRRFPQRFVKHQRGFDLNVSGRKEDLAHIAGERVIERRALGQPERGAGRPLVEHKQPQFAAKLAMVALFRFLESHEILGEFVLRIECDAIDALHLLALLVAAPVRAGDARQAEAFRIDFARSTDVGTAA